MMEFKLRRVHAMPRQLEAGVVYVSEEFEVATHLCACGCGNKVTTPLGPTEWSFKENRGKPTLSPSIGNWQWPCRSHYWITAGKVSWTGQWTSDQIESGRRAEEERRREYFESRKRRELSGLARIWNWFKKLFSWPRV